ncbi:MAG: 23S rRNA (pseudouridine(1915)-N(3))-methyltransferase RlmH [Gammaproteobacteria bacterium]|nr:23S rRNA (pseudouridine(1915)-N(3))-methyltransferase RlmH [Gammaproteobacteria bacterium]
MHLQIISIGQKMPSWVDQACADYQKRLPKELNVQWITLPLAQRKARGSVERLRRQEAEKISQKTSPGSYSIVLDEAGKHWRSLHWAKQLELWMQQHPRVNFIIGGSDGLSPELLKSCDVRVSLGSMTMPHALVRVVLIEQLYRAWCITRGHPYHRE